MNELDGFVIEEGRGFHRPVASVSFDGVVVLVRAAIAAARRNEVRDLLVELRAIRNTNAKTQKASDVSIASVQMDFE